MTTTLTIDVPGHDGVEVTHDGGATSFKGIALSAWDERGTGTIAFDDLKVAGDMSEGANEMSDAMPGSNRHRSACGRDRRSCCGRTGTSWAPSSRSCSSRPSTSERTRGDDRRCPAVGNWLLVLGGFIVVGLLARGFAAAPLARDAVRRPRRVRRRRSIDLHPAALGGRVTAPGAIASAGILTIIGFVGLTVIAFTSGVDFSVAAGLLRWGGVVALVIIVAAVLFGLHLGAWFAIAMIALAGVAVPLRHRTGADDHARRHVRRASFELFSSVALMFWYAISLFSRN